MIEPDSLSKRSGGDRRGIRAIRSSTTALMISFVCGCAGAGEVATAHGAANIVSANENRREVWVDDKVSTKARL